MRIPSFAVRDQRSVRNAHCDTVPKLMIIAGPNGCGKSTLLNAIWEGAGKTHVMYVAPHRSIQPQTVMQRHLLAPPISLEVTLAGSNVSGPEGVQIHRNRRDQWAHDEAGSLLKHSLCQIEYDRKQAIANRYDTKRSIAENSVPDPWKPLREITEHLLPHLRFHKIEMSNRDHITVQWKAHNLEALIDLDYLSSGEKSVIQMFYPLIEREIRSILKLIESGEPPPGQDKSNPAQEIETCVLIDEPELHLHPNLQHKVVDYLRELTSKKNQQVIVTTHSPTIVEYASPEELYLLRPAEKVSPGENQLVLIADDTARLQELRDVFGGLSNLTSLQPMVVVESIAEQKARGVIPDRKIYRALHPDFDRVTLIPGGGKQECKALLRGMAEAFSKLSPQLKAIALLDNDGEANREESEIQLLPVCMIENFLLDPESIWEAIQSVVERTSFKGPDDISKALDDLLDSHEQAEIQRRATAHLEPVHFHPPSNLAELPNKLEDHVRLVRCKYSESSIDSAKTNAESRVRSIRDSKRRREDFHGKDVLKKFFAEHLHSTSLSKEVFSYYAAQRARQRKSVAEFFDQFFKKILIPATNAVAPKG